MLYGNKNTTSHNSRYYAIEKLEVCIEDHFISFLKYCLIALSNYAKKLGEYILGKHSLSHIRETEKLTCSLSFLHFINMQTILVTGGTGLVGRGIQLALERTKNDGKQANEN